MRLRESEIYRQRVEIQLIENTNKKEITPDTHLNIFCLQHLYFRVIFDGLPFSLLKPLG